MTKTAAFLGVGIAVVAVAGGVIWKTTYSGPRGAVVKARDALVALDIERFRGLMSNVAQRRFESVLYDEVNDVRSKDRLAKVLELPVVEVRRWDAWQYMAAVANHKEKLTVAGLNVVADLTAFSDVFSKAEVGEAVIDGERAVVSVKLVAQADTKSGSVDLVRENGEWRLFYLRWGNEPPLWDPVEDPPTVSQRKREARSEARSVLSSFGLYQQQQLERKERFGTTFKELGFEPELGNRYTYFMSNSGPAQLRDSSAGKQELADDTVVIGYDRGRFLGQVDLKAFSDTKCPLTLKTPESDGPRGPGVTRSGKFEVFMAVAAAKLDNGDGFDCWSVASLTRIGADGSPIYPWQPLLETSGEPFVPHAGMASVANEAANHPERTSRKAVDSGPEKGGEHLGLLHGKVSLGAVEVESADVGRDTITRELQAKAVDRVRRCYSDSLDKSPGVKGRLVVRATLTSGGRLMETEVEENTTGAGELAACARRALTGIRLKVNVASDEAVPIAVGFVLTPE